MSDENTNLVKLMIDAADGKPNAIEQFYRKLLVSKLYYLKSPQKKNIIEIVGESHAATLSALIVEKDGLETIPVFTNEDYAKSWVEENEYNIDTIEFSKLIWNLGKTIYLHLNPGQEIGKEINPWEVELLKSGEDAIPELVADYESEMSSDITVKSGNEIYSELKSKLLPILEIYPELEEAFIISYSEDDPDDEDSNFPMVGIKYKNISEEKKKYIRDEIASLAQDCIPEDKDIVVIDDLGNTNSPNHRLFQDVSPFYISAYILKEEDNLLSKISRFFKRNKK